MYIIHIIGELCIGKMRVFSIKGFYQPNAARGSTFNLKKSESDV